MLDTQTLEQFITSSLTDLGLELVRMNVGGAPRQPRITLFVDRVGGVTIGECVEATKELKKRLMVHFDPGLQFSLNISSPGTDRPLKSQKDFHLITGRKVSITYAGDDEQAERIKVEGTVTSAGECEIELQKKDDSTIVIPYSKILNARISLPF